MRMQTGLSCAAPGATARTARHTCSPRCGTLGGTAVSFGAPLASGAMLRRSAATVSPRCHCQPPLQLRPIRCRFAAASAGPCQRCNCGRCRRGSCASRVMYI